MNILIITASFPYPLNSGGNQAQFNMIDKLRSRVNFSLLYFRKYSFLEDEKILKDLWPEVRFYPIDIPILPKKNCLQKAVNKLWKLIYKPQKRVLNIEYEFSTLHDRSGEFINTEFIEFVAKIITYDKIDIVQTEFYPMQDE